MPLNPNLPAPSALIDSAELRSQFAAAHAALNERPTYTELHNAISSLPLPNSNNVPTFTEEGLSFANTDSQQLANKLDALITALRR